MRTCGSRRAVFSRSSVATSACQYARGAAEHVAYPMPDCPLVAALGGKAQSFKIRSEPIHAAVTSMNIATADWWAWENASSAGMMRAAKIAQRADNPRNALPSHR
jgi:hypothetical protein